MQRANFSFFLKKRKIKNKRNSWSFDEGWTKFTYLIYFFESLIQNWTNGTFFTFFCGSLLLWRNEMTVGIFPMPLGENCCLQVAKRRPIQFYYSELCDNFRIPFQPTVRYLVIWKGNKSPRVPNSPQSAMIVFMPLANTILIDD